MHPRLNCLLVVCLLLAASITQAQVPETMTVQGRLTDDTGAPVAAGGRDFSFKIYNTETGGLVLWPGIGDPDDEVTVYTDENGLWTAQIGTVVPLTVGIFNGKDAWLEITISVKGGLPEVLPRILLQTNPYSFRVGTIDDADGGTIVSDVEIEGALDLGDATHAGQLDLYAGDGSDPVVSLQTDAYQNGRIEVHNATGTNRCTIDGGYAETGDPLLYLQGSQKTVALYTDITGNTSVLLGSDAVHDLEILDEPGVAFSASNTTYGISTSWMSFRSRSITVPASGYVIAVGSFSVYANHSSGTYTEANFAITRDLEAVSNLQGTAFSISSATPSSAKMIPLALTTVFPVSSGTHTVYMAAQELSGTVMAGDSRLSLIYVPTAYGDVTDVEMTTTPGDDIVREGGLTQAEIDQERTDAEAFDRARMQSELDAMQAEIDAMKARLDADHNAASGSRE